MIDSDEANGHHVAKPSFEQVADVPANHRDEDVPMNESEEIAPSNGQINASELLGSSALRAEPAPALETPAVEAPLVPIEMPTPAPEHVEQPVSDMRDEAPSQTVPAINDDAMMLDEPGEPQSEDTSNAFLERAHEPIISHVESSPAPEPSNQESTATGEAALPVSSSSEATAARPQENSYSQPLPIHNDMSTTTGQVRQRDEDGAEEPNAKRTKVTPETDAASSSVVPDSSAPSGAPTTMAPPSALPYIAPDFDDRPLMRSQQRYLLDSVRKAKKIKAAIPFLYPVDPVAMNIPTYTTIVPNPMDLSTIEDKLKNDRYSSANALWADMELMVENCNAFNGISHPVTQSGLNLRAYFNKLMQSIPKGDISNESASKKKAGSPKPSLPRRESRNVSVTKPEPAPSKLPPKPANKTPASKSKVETKKHEPVLNNDGLPVIRRASESERPKREIIKPPPRDLPYSSASLKPKKKHSQMELQFCEQVVMKELKKSKNQSFAWPFMTAVDPVAMNIPTYYTIVKKPMDFGTVEQNLQDNVYSTAKQFYNDSKLVFSNCYLFNPLTDAVNEMGHQLEAVFDEAWEKKDEWIAANQPVSEPASEDESEAESSEEEEISVEDRMAKIVELQKQIAKLTSEMVALSNPPPKKKSKKVKGDGHKKRKSIAAGATGPVKAPRPKKVAKPKKLSLDQKRYVSDSIMMLDEVNMRKAVQMIRNGVPKLRDVHDDELELDVDEIPDNVLQTLYKFVKDYRRTNGTDAMSNDEDYDEPEPPRQATGSTHRKKNKPMSAREQESKIAQVKQQLQQFNQSGSEQGNNDGKSGAMA